MRISLRKLLILVLAVVLVPAAVTGCISTEQVEQKAYNYVLEELKAHGHPTGMFGVTWYMTQQDVKNVLNNCDQLDANTLVQQTILYERPVQVGYFFKDNRLYIIVVSFKEEFTSAEEFADAFYEVQDNLSRDYGQMPEPVMYELIPPANGTWKDQDFLESKKELGRVHLIHQIRIKDNAMGEQILMFLGKEES